MTLYDDEARVQQRAFHKTQLIQPDHMNGINRHFSFCRHLLRIYFSAENDQECLDKICRA